MWRCDYRGRETDDGQTNPPPCLPACAARRAPARRVTAPHSTSRPTTSSACSLERAYNVLSNLHVVHVAGRFLSLDLDLLSL